jgi:hypothetical protein
LDYVDLNRANSLFRVSFKKALSDLARSTVPDLLSLLRKNEVADPEILLLTPVEAVLATFDPKAKKIEKSGVS